MKKREAKPRVLNFKGGKINFDEGGKHSPPPP